MKELVLGVVVGMWVVVVLRNRLWLFSLFGQSGILRHTLRSVVWLVVVVWVDRIEEAMDVPDGTNMNQSRDLLHDSWSVIWGVLGKGRYLMAGLNIRILQALTPNSLILTRHRIVRHYNWVKNTCSWIWIWPYYPTSRDHWPAAILGPGTTVIGL